MIYTGDKTELGIAIGLTRSEGDSPETIHTIAVEDARLSTEKVVKHGGKIINPVHAIPGVGWAAHVEDTEGNKWGLMQVDSNVK